MNAVPHSPAELLPEGLAAQVEAATGAKLADAKPRGAGGASREGAELVLRYRDGAEVKAFMNYDVHRAGAGNDAAFLAEAAIIRELSGALSGKGVRTGGFIAAIPESRALITSFVEGEADFNKLTTAEARHEVAADFLAQLARLHAIDVKAHPIAELGAPRPPSEMIPERLAEMRARIAEYPGDALIRLSLDWLEENIPADPARLVIVHGDAGPANFLYRDNRVAALVDWELVHYGDPMADFGMLCMRMLFQPFISMPEAFAAYQAAGGGEIDLDRIRYWRLFFQTGFQTRRRPNDPAAARPPNLGMNMVYSSVNRRVLSEALAELAGAPVSAIRLPDSPPGAHDLSFEIALEDLRDAIVPGTSIPRAAVKAKGLARLIKWWRASERYGPALQAEELAELSAALGRSFTDLAEGRQALSDAVNAKAIDSKLAIRLAHAQVTRDALLMADAAGAVSKSHFPPLE